MRKLIIIHQHDPEINHVGGVGTFINTLIKYAPEDFKVSLVGVSADPLERPIGRWQRLEKGGREFDFLPIIKAHPTYHHRFPLSLKFGAALWRRRRQIDFKNALIELHRIEPELMLRGLPNSKVLFFHTHPKDLYNPKTEVSWRHFPSLYFWLEQRLIRKMNRLYSVREDTIDWYRDRYPGLRKPFFFLPTWADEEVFYSLPEEERKKKREELLRANGLNPGGKILLFVGRFELQKDPHLLLESFREFQARNPGAQLVMIGEGSLGGSLRQALARHKLETKVRILPPQPQTVVAGWMNAADSLLLTSAYEGMPRVVMEALQSGLPVVGMEGSEASRVVQNGTGRLVKERDPKIICKALEEVLSKAPDRKACREAVAPFGARQILEELFASYRLLNGKVPEPRKITNPVKLLSGAARRFREKGLSHVIAYSLGRFYVVRSFLVSWNKRFGSPGRHDLSRSLFSGAGTEQILRDLNENSFAAGLTLPGEALSEIFRYVEKEKCVSAVGKKEYHYLYSEKEEAERRAGRGFILGRYPEPASVSPALTRLEKDPLLFEITSRYLHAEPRKIDTQLWWSYAVEAGLEERLRSRQTVLFHYDTEGFLLLYFNFYLTDVDEKSGPHIVVRGSHGRKKWYDLVGSTNQREEEIVRRYGREKIFTLCGRAGFGFVEDSYCFHRAEAPAAHDRLFLQIRMLV